MTSDPLPGEPLQVPVRRRLALLPLQAAVALSGIIWNEIRKRRQAPIRHNVTVTENEKISIVIPERANAALLGECLRSVVDACAAISQPAEVIVVVNGSPQEAYRKLMDRYSDAQWLFFDSPLSFSEAIRRGLQVAGYEWVYLLNNDMVLDRPALREVLQWRAPQVFAVASQIFFKDERRREETGWTGFEFEDGCIRIHDAAPQDDVAVRGNLYAGGGCSLFQKQLLQKVLGKHDSYRPFYWEDVEWGAIALKLGFDILFCPSSKAWHSHRATIAKFFSREDIACIFRRNGIQFQLRNLHRLGSFERLCASIMNLDSPSVHELLRIRNVWEVFKARVRSAFYPFDDSCLLYACDKYYFRPPAQVRSKPAMLFVTPFALNPQAHGGAVRMNGLLRHVAADFEVIVLSDEREAYAGVKSELFLGLEAIHLVGGRAENAGITQNRIERINSHCHRILREELQKRLACDKPDLVQIEFMELARLVEMKRGGKPWVITLHDVPFSGTHEKPTEEDIFESALISRYDAVIACSVEDAGLLRNVNVHVVPNGVDLERFDCGNSEGNTSILFMGPFRYKPNLEGIQMFLKAVYPQLRKSVPAAQLWLLGGQDAVEIASNLPTFRQAGVTVYDHIADSFPFLKRCAVTINPLIKTRGSSIKLIESVAAGRVCVSTIDGARGFLDAGFTSLIAVEKIRDFLHPLERLLLEPAFRLSLEKPDKQKLRNYAWVKSAQMLREVYRHCLAKT